MALYRLRAGWYCLAGPQYPLQLHCPHRARHRARLSSFPCHPPPFLPCRSPWRPARCCSPTSTPTPSSSSPSPVSEAPHSAGAPLSGRPARSSGAGRAVGRFGTLCAALPHRSTALWCAAGWHTARVTPPAAALPAPSAPLFSPISPTTHPLTHPLPSPCCRQGRPLRGVQQHDPGHCHREHHEGCADPRLCRLPHR
jgi:hypothetical protein